MALDIYVGGFVGLGDAEEADVRAVVTRWQDALDRSLPVPGQRVERWREAADAPTHRARLPWRSLGGLVLAAAAHQLEAPAPDRVSERWPESELLEAVRAVRPRDSAYHTLYDVQLWVPGDFDGIVATGGPGQDEGGTASVDRLAAQLAALRFVVRLPLAGEPPVPAVEAPLAEHARHGLFLLDRAARLACGERLPLLLLA